MQFSVIHENAQGYRNDFKELHDLLLQLSEEKGKGQPLVSWFRLRNRRIAQVLKPMHSEVSQLIRKERKKEEYYLEAFDGLRQAKQAVEGNKITYAEIILSEKVARYFKIENHLSTEKNKAMQELISLESQLKKRFSLVENNMKYLEKVLRDIESTIDLFASTKRTKDIDIDEFSTAISVINKEKNDLDLQLPDLKELPETYSKTVVENLHDQIRMKISDIDARYNMKIFEQPKKRLRIIVHDISNDRGMKAFNNRANEIETLTNESINIFNKKYWQITGQRWERVGTNSHGYRTVAATHDQIEEI